MGVKDVNVLFVNQPANGFKPGDVVSGKVRIKINKDTHLSDLSILLQGKAKVGFYSHHVMWFNKDYRLRGDNCNRQLSIGGIFDVNWNDIRIHRRLSDSQFFRGEEMFIDINYQLSGETRLKEGYHEFTFSFQLPAKIPSSFSSTYGHIRYKLKVKWCKTGFLSCTNTHKVEFSVVSPYIYSYLTNKNLFVPVLYKEITPFRVLFSSTNPFTIEVTLPKSVFRKGEIINAEVKLNNTSDFNIKAVSLFLARRSAWIGKYWQMKNIRMVDDILQEIRFEGVPAGEAKTWNQPITINTEPILNIDECSIIKVYNLILVKVVAPGLYENITVSCPIIVCDDFYDQSHNRVEFFNDYGFRPEVTQNDFTQPSSSNAALGFDLSDPPPPYPGTP